MAGSVMSPRLKAKAREVEELEAQVNAAMAKEAALGYPVSAFPPTNIDGALVPSGDVEHEATLAGAGRGAGISMVDPRAWYAKQRAIITAEMHKEYREMQEKLLERFKLQMERVHLELEREKVKGMEAIQLKKEIRMKEEMEYRAKVGKKEDILIVTTSRVPGYRIKEVCSTVMGFGMIEVDESEDTPEEVMLSPHIARSHAVEHMIADAQRVHANAVVSFQWMIRPLDSERTKVLAQGTAVIIEKEGPVQCGECGTIKKGQKGGGPAGGNDQKGNDKHSHDEALVASSGGGSAPNNAQKQKQQLQQQKGNKGGGNAAGGGDKSNLNTAAQQIQQPQSQGKKNKGKQNQSKHYDNNDEETGPDDDDNDNVEQSDADDNDTISAKSKNQKEKGQNSQNQGGGGGGKGGKGQKLTATQQIIKLLAESKIREEKKVAEETEKERLYKHMEEYFRMRDGKSSTSRGYGNSGWGSSSFGSGFAKKEMSTMEWLKQIEKEIEERNAKKSGASGFADGKGGGKGKTDWPPSASKNSRNGTIGWGGTDDNNDQTSSEPVGWGDTADDASKNNNKNSKSKQKGKGRQNNDAPADWTATSSSNQGGSQTGHSPSNPTPSPAQGNRGSQQGSASAWGASHPSAQGGDTSQNDGMWGADDDNNDNNNGHIGSPPPTWGNGQSGGNNDAWA